VAWARGVPDPPFRPYVRWPSAEVAALVDEHGERRADGTRLDELADAGHVLRHAVGTASPNSAQAVRVSSSISLFNRSHNRPCLSSVTPHGDTRVSAVPDIAARGDLAEGALEPSEGRHHAAVSSTLILGERRIDLRQAHHPDELAAVHRAPLLHGIVFFRLCPNT
jgi:hypothetical protein